MRRLRRRKRRVAVAVVLVPLHAQERRRRLLQALVVTYEAKALLLWEGGSSDSDGAEQRGCQTKSCDFFYLFVYFFQLSREYLHGAREYLQGAHEDIHDSTGKSFQSWKNVPKFDKMFRT